MKLPTGEPLDGKKAYEKIMPYFTTVDLTPDDVHNLGFEMLNKLYPEVRWKKPSENLRIEGNCRRRFIAGYSLVWYTLAQLFTSVSVNSGARLFKAR